MSVIVDLTTVYVENVSPILDITSDECEPIVVFHRCVVDLSIVNDDDVTPIVVKRCVVDLSIANDDDVTPIVVKRCIVDLSIANDDDVTPIVALRRSIVDVSDINYDVVPIVKRPRLLLGAKECIKQERLILKLRELPRELVMKIFDDYLDVIFIKEILMTPTNILRATICIHHSIESRIVPSKTLTDISTISKFIIEHLRERASMFIIFALRNSVVVPSLQVNDSFDYYEPNKYGKYIVLKVFKSSAIVQRIKHQEKKLYYNGMVFKTVVKVSQKRRISMKILNNRCIFNPEREQSVCFINNLGTPTEIVYYSDGGVIVEKHRNMSNYIIE
jgi:hypothetical protein